MSSSTSWAIHAGDRAHRLGRLQLACIALPLNRGNEDFTDTSNVSDSALRSMSGNGMSLPCAGFVILMTVLFVENI